MAARWMQSKMLKLKRDGMRDSRGPFDRFKDEPSEATTPRIRAGDGWYVQPAGTYRRGLPSALGPFATEVDANAFCKRGHITEYSLRQRVTVKRAEDLTIGRKAKITAECAVMAEEHRAKLQAQRDLSRATREALGKRTAWAR